MASYPIVLVVVYCLGALPLTHQLTGSGRARLSPQAAYVLVSVPVAGYAVFVLGPGESLRILTGSQQPGALALMVGGGALAGLLVQKLDVVLVRRLVRSGTGRPGTAKEHGPRAGLAAVLLVACAEEVLFRGVLLHLGLRLPPVLAAIAIAATTAYFAAQHVFLGLVQVVAKLLLGVAAVVAVLGTGATATAIALHVSFNFLAFRSARAPRPAKPPVIEEVGTR